MPTKQKAVKADKEFHAVEFFRKVKEQIAKETEGMSFEQLKKYFSEKTKESKLKSQGRR